MIEKYREIVGKDIIELGFKKLLLTGEPGIGIPAVRSRIEGLFGGKWCDWLAPNGEGFSGSCGLNEYAGVHEVAPELSICCEDLIDPVTKKPVALRDGAIGEPAITSLDRKGVPYIKYALGDVVQVFTKKCSCDYPGPGYRKRVLGRVEDMLRVGDVITFPTEIKNSINLFVPRLTGAMRIVLTEAPPDVIPPLKIKLEYGRDIQKSQLKQLEHEVKEKLLKDNNIQSELEFVPSDTLDRTRFKTPFFEKRYE
jgi:phenylacetate-CoA ligase